MKISARASGGFCPVAEHYDIDTAACPHQGAAVEAALLRALAATRPAPTVGADLVRWEIAVTDGARRHHITFAEDGSAAAAPWQALVAALRACG